MRPCRCCEHANSRYRPSILSIELYAEGHALALLAVLAARFGQPTASAHGVLPSRRLKMLTDYIQANLGNAVSLAELASVARMSQSQLVRAFRASTGYTPIDYLIRQRVKEARRLLASTNVPLSEIAVCLGFADQSHFTRRFRKATGATPAQFRRLAL